MNTIAFDSYKMSNTHFVDKHFAPGQLLLKLHGPGNLVEANKGCMVEGVRIKLHWRLGGGGSFCSLEKSNLRRR